MTDITARFESYFIPEPNSGCWLWIGAASSIYGRFYFNGKTLRAYQVAWILAGNDLPEYGYCLDHKCCNTWCVNPSHLELVTLSENSRRGNLRRHKTICMNGHEFTEDNTYLYKGVRHCRQCRRDRDYVAYYK